MRLVLAYSRSLRAGIVAPDRHDAEAYANANAAIHGMNTRDFIIREVDIED